MPAGQFLRHDLGASRVHSRRLRASSSVPDDFKKFLKAELIKL